ncbi:cell envelope biogenesis protein OmpA [Streptomyces sp. NBC_00687]|uniref:cell envelope biogenesis protein OmpA n=1 Tax=Streptomyces sp. NBC_00687 TaxID=2975807 RepID=UPI002258A6FB|nr:cell envelope biogenesis protein OmpA [Streptomyces sp. NBC_00687]MCX4919843.1 cell envelope biogenesis protein OmpA [Streptomyces sp. NBC_00687]
MHPIPQRCARRPLSGGLVVPYVSVIHGGHAAFGSLHAERARTALLQGLCQICGERLEERCFLIVRPADAVRGISPEPALHPECLPYTAAHCPMLNGTVTHYRSRAVLTGHPAGRPCADPTCPCPSSAPDQGHIARSGARADHYEAWMIHTRNYRLTGPDDQPGVIDGISSDVPVLRRRLLRKATLSREQEDQMRILRAVLDATSDLTLPDSSCPKETP